jgi:hypothetical protein
LFRKCGAAKNSTLGAADEERELQLSKEQCNVLAA